MTSINEKIRQPDSLSDSPPRRKHKSSKKEKIGEMKIKIKAILAKVEQLENEKKQDREQLKKLVGHAQKLEQLTARKAQKCEQLLASSSISKNNRMQHSDISRNQPHPKKLEQQRLAHSLVVKYTDKSFKRSEAIKIKRVKKEKIQMKNETVMNFAAAVLFGIALILIVKTFV